MKVGIKVFVLAEASTGYCWNFDVYTGKAGNTDSEVGNLGKTNKVVVNLSKELTHRGHHLYMDNFYTSVTLLLYMERQGILACGTIRSNRQYYPHQLLGNEIKKKRKGGEQVCKPYGANCFGLERHKASLFPQCHS